MPAFWGHQEESCEAIIRLDDIRPNLFYGLLDYTKSFPDFCIPQRFSMASPKEGRRLLEEMDSSLSEEKQILLYVHLPFCSSECVFCNAFPQKASRSVQEEYVEGLLGEIEIYSSVGHLQRERGQVRLLRRRNPDRVSNRGYPEASSRESRLV